MYGVLTVIIVQLMFTPKPGLSAKPTSDSMLSKDLASAVESWSSALDNRVVVYRGFDVDVPCLENHKNDGSKKTVASNKSYVWYDKDNKTVRTALCSVCQTNVSLVLLRSAVLSKTQFPLAWYTPTCAHDDVQDAWTSWAHRGRGHGSERIWFCTPQCIKPDLTIAHRNLHFFPTPTTVLHWGL